MPDSPKNPMLPWKAGDELRLGQPITATLPRAAALSGLSVSTLRRRAQEGLLATVRVGGRRLVVMESLRALLSGE